MRREIPIVTAQLEARLRRQNVQISKLRGLVENYDGLFWKQVVPTLETRLRNIEVAREDGFLKMTETELKVAIAREIEIKEFMRLPQTARDLLARMAEENALLREQLRKKKKLSL